MLINEDNTNTLGIWKSARLTAQVIYVSPEMALSNSFAKLWTDATFRRRVQALIVDEAHCIEEWGEEFRPLYRELHRLRNFTGQEIPFVACTATCSMTTFDTIWNSLGFGHRPFWGIDVGSDHQNLLYLTRPLVNKKDPILDILNLLPPDLDKTSGCETIPKNTRCVQILVRSSRG